MLSKEGLGLEIEAITATIVLLVEYYGMNTKLEIEGETEEEIKEGREMYNQHLKFLGSIGLVNEYTINNNSVNVTVSSHILGFYAAYIDEIELISSLNSDPNKVIKAFNKMFPQERDHCSECCPYIEDEELIDHG